MAVPKRRTSKQTKRTRRTHKCLTVVNTGVCFKCGEPRLPHRICSVCGYYKERYVKQYETE